MILRIRSNYDSMILLCGVPTQIPMPDWDGGHGVLDLFLWGTRFKLLFCPEAQWVNGVQLLHLDLTTCLDLHLPLH